MRGFIEFCIVVILAVLITAGLTSIVEGAVPTPTPTPTPQLTAEDVFPKALKERNLKLCIAQTEQPRLCGCMSDTLLEVLLIIQVPLNRLHEAPPHILEMVKEAVLGTCAPLAEEKQA
jgi:hypothetical protein